MKCEWWIRAKKKWLLNRNQKSNPLPPEQQAGALSTELQEVMENKVI